MLDADLAVFYGVTLEHLHEQVLKNQARLSADFMFELNSEETAMMAANNITLSLEQPTMVFTEQGILMMANLLESTLAIDMSLRMVHILVKMSAFFNTRIF